MFPWTLWVPRSLFFYPCLGVNGGMRVHVSEPQYRVIDDVMCCTRTLNFIFRSSQDLGWHVRHLTVVEGPDTEDLLLGLHVPGADLMSADADAMTWLDRGRATPQTDILLEPRAPYRWRTELPRKERPGYVACRLHPMEAIQMQTEDGCVSRQSWAPSSSSPPGTDEMDADKDDENSSPV